VASDIYTVGRQLAARHCDERTRRPLRSDGLHEWTTRCLQIRISFRPVLRSRNHPRPRRRSPASAEEIVRAASGVLREVVAKDNGGDGGVFDDLFLAAVDVAKTAGRLLRRYRRPCAFGEADRKGDRSPRCRYRWRSGDVAAPLMGAKGVSTGCRRWIVRAFRTAQWIPRIIDVGVCEPALMGAVVTGPWR